MADLAFAMCLRSKLADVQKNGLNFSVKLYSTEEDAVNKTYFPIVTQDSIEQGVLLYVKMEWLDHHVRKDGVIELSGNSANIGIAGWRVGVIRVGIMRYRNPRKPRVKVDDAAPKPVKIPKAPKVVLTKEERKKKTSEAMKNYWMKRKAKNLDVGMTIATL